MMVFTLEHLLSDSRLARLFSAEARHCALQLWVLQIKSDNSIENRIVYGRLLPYRYSNNCWSIRDRDKYQPFGQIKAKVVCLNLYVSSTNCAELLRQLSAGHSISAISESMKLECLEPQGKQYGETKFPVGRLVYRPVSYLLNRDASGQQLSSPHGAAGAFSASITQVDKSSLFRLGDEYDVALTALVVRQINEATGLDFGGVDATRFGDLELLVFPTLNDSEQDLLSVERCKSPGSLVVRFDSIQVPNFEKFQFHLKIEHHGQIVYSSLASAHRDDSGVFQCEFQLSDELREITDSAELEIFGFHNDFSHAGVLCCRWRGGYIREVCLRCHVVGQSASPIKFDWLEKTAKPVTSARVIAARTHSQKNLGFTSNHGGRNVDPWVPANLELLSLFNRLHPPKSDGRFFLRWGPSNGEGRLQFVEWFRALLSKYHQHQVAIFDPYFEDVGLTLLLLEAPNSDFVVFTRVSTKKEDSDRVNKLISGCNRNSNLLRKKRIKLRICGLKRDLHDRYILVMGSDGLPVAGFHLSNSFQTVAENYPLLVTPIPADVLLTVAQYMVDLLEKLQCKKSDSESENSAMQLLFDSTTVQVEPSYESRSFLENPEAGNVLSVWCDEPLLKGLNGEHLKAQMAALNLLKGDTFVLPDGLCRCINKQSIDFKNFAATWEVLGEVLARSNVEDEVKIDFSSQDNFLKFLSQYLKNAFNRKHGKVREELSVIDVGFFQKSLDECLRSSSHIDHLFHPTKYAALTWSEYYAIKILWRYAPNDLLIIAQEQISSLPKDVDERSVVPLSLLSQIVSEISLSIQFGISEDQRSCLVQSTGDLFSWMGLCAIEQQLETLEGRDSVLLFLRNFPDFERVRALGWMIHRATLSSNKSDIYQALIAELKGVLPEKLDKKGLQNLVDSMRGHMRQLAFTEPWLFQDVILPLLRSEVASIHDAGDLWMEELVGMLGATLIEQSRFFDRAREGAMTKTAAFLFAQCDSAWRKRWLENMQAILKKQRQIVQQPLASTLNWRLWDDALKVSLWILAFCRWGEYYLRKHTEIDGELIFLSKDARDLAMIKPMEEWRAENIGKQGEIVGFLDQVESLLNDFIS